jgi:hypothetical protein
MDFKKTLAQPRAEENLVAVIGLNRTVRVNLHWQHGLVGEIASLNGLEPLERGIPLPKQPSDPLFPIHISMDISKAIAQVNG